MAKIAVDNHTDPGPAGIDMIQRVKRRFRLILSSILCLSAQVLATAQEPIQLPRVDKVSIRSNQAWEDTEPSVMHFSGDFNLTAADWFVSADSATLYGNLDDPETVVLQGAPATFRVRAVHDQAEETVSGDARQITYLRRLQVVRLEREARLHWGDTVIRGAEIEYDLETDRFRASGPEGISLLMPHVD
jgi:lipopolysaccharide transport protein LptA